MSIIIVRNDAELLDQCDKIKKSGTNYIALDTEFIRNKRVFIPKISTIQIEFLDNLILIDCMSSNLQCYDPLSEILSSKNILKLFFDYQQDLMALSNIIKIIPSPVVDVQRAFMLSSYNIHPVSYAGMVEKYFQIKIDKVEKRSNWTIRPLTDNQIEYAVTDVKYLNKLFRIVQLSLNQKNRLSWLYEDMDLLLNFSGSNHVENCLYHAVYADLSKIRREEASKLNFEPDTAVMSDINMMFMSKSMVDHNNYLSQIIKKSKINKNKLKSIMECYPYLIDKAHSNEESQIINFVKSYVKIICIRNDISFNVAIDRNHILYLAIVAKEKRIPIYNGWRKELFGTDIEECLSGKRSLFLEMSFEENNVVFGSKNNKVKN
ncbi:ribonuclease D [Anaplasmataceae bacterium AB001_6]|nr:ribonuclease D [Anaplasmataceae bacterium AB001_6]